MDSTVGDSRRRKAQAILGASDGTMQFTTLKSPQQQQNEAEEEVPQAVAAETKSAAVTNHQDEDEAASITTFWNLHDEVEKLKEAKEIQVRDGQTNEQEGQDDEQYHEIYYGEETGSNLGIFILPADEDHSSSVTVDELRGEEETPNTPYHIFHKKDSEENVATGNYGDYSGGSSLPGVGGSSSTSGGSSSSSSSSISPEESQLRDILNNVKELGANVDASVHQKTSSEKNGVNDPLRAPSNFDFYNPGAGGAGGGPGVGNSNGGETIAPPRGNEGPTSQPTSFGKRNCKATNGAFGDNRQERSGGGVTLKFQYELNTDATPGGPFQRASLYNEILPALEDAMVTVMLPAFFSDECMRIPSSGTVSRRKVRNRFLRGGGIGNDHDIELFDEFDFDQDFTFGYQHQHRRLNRVIGIDSDPMDFPLNGKACYGGYKPPNPTIVPKCYVMEGALTIYFPENYNFKNLVTGAQLTALNTIKEGMEFGTVAEMAHPAILDLTFLESSYSLRPLLPGGESIQAVAPPPKESGGGGNVGLIVGIIIVLVVFVIIAGCFFRYRLKQEQAKLDAMMRESTQKKKKKKKKKADRDDDSDNSSDGTPADPTSLYILNRYASEMHDKDDDDDADDEDNLTDREKEIHQRLKKRRKTKKKMRRLSMASNLSSNHDGSFSTLDTDSDRNLMDYYANMAASGTTGSKTTTSSDSTTDVSGTDVSGSESSTTSHNSHTFHTTSTGTSENTTSDSGTSSAGTTSDSDDDSEEEDAFDMNDVNFNLGGAAGNFSNGAMKTQPRKKKGQRSNLIMTGDDDGSVGTEATGATEAISNVNRGGAVGGGGGGAFGGGASVATEVISNVGRGGGGAYGGGSEFGGGASVATEVMGNVGRGGGGAYGGASEFGGGASVATEVMGNVGRGGRGAYGGGSEFGGGGFSGGASAAPSVDFSAATEAMGNLRSRAGPGRYGGGGGFSGGASAAPSVDFSAATEAINNTNRRKPLGSGGSAGPGASVAMSAATEAIKNTGRGKKPQQMESIGELTFSDF